MKSITLKNLELTNFKGTRKFSLKPNAKETSVFGDNKTGKTTLVDAFIWLLFGKDSTDRSQFEIKTIDKTSGKVIPKIEHIVEAVIIEDGQEVKLKKTYREKWVTQRGTLDPVFKGNEALYEWNDVPVTAGEYSSKISSLIDEEIFKLITSPYAFNALDKDKQRQILLDISGGINEEEIINSDLEFKELFAKLTNKSLEEYEKQLKASISKSKKEIQAIPTRIDEVELGKPDAIDFEDIRIDIAANKKELQEIESQIQDKFKAQEKVNKKRIEVQNQIQKLEEDLSDIKHSAKLQAKDKLNNSTSTLTFLESESTKIEENIESSQKSLETLKVKRKKVADDIAEYEKKNNTIRENWHKLNAEEFKVDEDEFKCPTCQRSYEEDKVESKKEELKNNFLQQKQSNLDSIKQEGKANNEIIDINKKALADLDKRISKGENILAEQKELLKEIAVKITKEKEEVAKQKTLEEITVEILSGNKDYATKKKEVNSLSESLSEEKKVDTKELDKQKSLYEKEIEKLNKKLDDESAINRADKRIKELSDSQSTLSQKIADLEKDQFVIEKFNKAKDDALENLVNDRFELVKFKLFETQVNGAEVPTCKAMINGVPYSDLNTASRINAGLDIINVLSDHYQVRATIFIDNAESVTKLIATESQLIRLVVSEEHKTLTVK